MTFYFGWEIALIESLQAKLNPFLISFWRLVSSIGEEYIIIAIFGLFYWCINKEFGKKLGKNILITLVSGFILKNIFLRRRPYFESDRIDLLKKLEEDADIYDIASQGYSFPSGHSSNVSSAFGTVNKEFRNKWLKLLCIAIILLVGISRFVLGAHYPTDVLFGWALGLIVVLFEEKIESLFKKKEHFYALLIILSLSGFFFCTTHDYFTIEGVLIGFLLADLFESKYVNFKETKTPLEAILRIAGGGLVFIMCSSLFKMVFPASLLEAENQVAYLLRSLRYAVSIFMIAGVYPMCFKYLSK